MLNASQCFSSGELDLILSRIQAGIVVHAKDTSILYCNLAAQHILGLSEDEMLGKVAADPRWFIFDEHGERLDIEDYPVSWVLREGKGVRDAVYGVSRPKTGDKIWLQINATPVFEDDEITHVTMSFIDITTQIRVHRKLKRSEETFRKIYEMTPMGMCITDERGYFESVNPSYLELYGYAQDEVIGNHFTMVVPEENRSFLSDLHDKFIEDGIEIRGNWDVVDKSGAPRAVLADAALITGQDGRPKKVTFVMDITREREYERQLKKMAQTDALTGLFNRRYFFEEMDREIARSTRYDDPFSLLLLDIDYFKKINDTYGHNTGDAVLRHLTELMIHTFREPDVICRYGGEEFVVLMPSTKLQDSKAAAERFREAVEASAFPKDIRVTISGGVGQYGHGTIDNFISSVDALLYQSKEQGRNRITGQEP